MKFTAIIMECGQTGIDHWENYYRVLDCDENTTLGEIMAWQKKIRPAATGVCFSIAATEAPTPINSGEVRGG